MQCNLILAGVGGQGILTIAEAISRAALHRGLHVKQSEVHGMSQRGGAVQAHVRVADRPIDSDLIPNGEADLILAVEPLEALRYVNYLRECGVIVSSSVPFSNIPNYPPVENVLDRVGGFGEHVLIDAPKLAKAAGSARAENVVMLGAGTLFLDLPLADFERLIAETFAAKGERVVEVNRRALRIGRRAAAMFVESLRRGRSSRETRRALDAWPMDRLALLASAEEPAPVPESEDATLPEDACAAIDAILWSAHDDGRDQLLEHEIYRIIESAGAITPPVHRFVPANGTLTDLDLTAFPGDRIALKIVSPRIIHKSDVGGVVFVANRPDAVRAEIDRLLRLHQAGGRRVDGVLVVEFVESAQRGLGGELFVGLRQTREFGPVIAAGMGGVDTEFLAAAMRPGLAVAKASAMHTSPEDFFRAFEGTTAYDTLSGQARGHERLVSDGELRRCFRAFLAIARRYGVDGPGGRCVQELEVNPFGFRHQGLVPLDGRGRLGPPIRTPRPRPLEQAASLLEPKSIAVVGVSATRRNFGRVILDNIRECGFPPEHLHVIKEGTSEIDGVACVPSVFHLPEKVDLLVASIDADQTTALVDDVLCANEKSDACSSIILIPGGMGEKSGTESVHERLRQAVEKTRTAHRRAPVLLGGNCMGVRSAPGRFDTFFVPKEKLDARRNAPAKRCAIVSQSGAFLITRLSNLEYLDPALAVSIGNQVDLTVSDMLRVIARRDDIDCIGVYVEGFNDLDGLSFLDAVQEAIAAGKVVVFYKAGRTRAGRDAAQGHTASLAGDYDICQAAVAAAGAIVTDTFKEFEQLLELATDLHAKQVHGKRVGAISNAGYEAVGMADAVKGARYELAMPALDSDTRERLRHVLRLHHLDRLVDAKNPLDLTPMADDAAYEDCIRTMLLAETVDCLIVGCVPMTPALRTTSAEIRQAESLAFRIPRLFVASTKPIVFVVDCAGPYDDFARAVRASGVPLFRSADQAVRSVGRYLDFRCKQGASSAASDSPPTTPSEAIEPESARDHAGAPA